MRNVKIYTDGACSGNPGPGGWAAILIYNQYRKEIKGSEKDTTNNKMELLAVIRALEALTEACAVDVYCDSRYVIDAIERGWIEAWRKSNWMTSANSPVKNRDMWEALIKLAEFHKLKFVKVLAHADDADNNRCDELAKSAIIELLNKAKKKAEARSAKKKAQAPLPDAPVDEKPADEKKADAASPAAPKKIKAVSTGSALKNKAKK